MNITFANALLSLRPGAEWEMRENADRTDFSLTWFDTEQTEPTKAEINAERTRLVALQPWNELRSKRNQLLAETDYLALYDVTMSDEMKTYRQALRDLPANTSDPANPTWPTKPGG